MSEEKKDSAMVPAESQASKNLQAMDTPTNYIPSLKITYAISEHFIQQKAKLGEFFYNNELALGTSIKASAVGYRYQVIARDKNSKDFVESLVLAESDTPFRMRDEYKDFCKQNVKHDIIDGVDILLFLPDHNLYCVLFCRKKLLKGGLQILEKGANGSIVKITTIPKSWKKLSWYVLEVQGLGEKVECPDVDSKLEIYNSQTVEQSSTDDTDGEGDERQR